MKTLTSKQIGSWDKAGRFIINDNYETESSKNIRKPSRNWPYSHYKHIFTKKYAKQLSGQIGEEIKIIK